MSDHREDPGGERKGPARLFASGNLSEEQTAREHDTPADVFDPSADTLVGPAKPAPDDDNFRPGAPTRLAAPLEASAPRPVPPAAPRTEMRRLAELDPRLSDEVIHEAPTRLNHQVLEDDEIELSVRDAEAITPLPPPPSAAARPPPVTPTAPTAPRAPAPLSSRAPPPPSRAGVAPREPVTVPARLPTGFVDRASLASHHEPSGPRPVPVAPPGQGVGRADSVDNPFRAAATMVDLKSISSEEPPLSELDVEVDDSALQPLAEETPALPAGFDAERAPFEIPPVTPGNPLEDAADRVPTQNIRIELEAERAFEAEAHLRSLAEEDEATESLGVISPPSSPAERPPPPSRSAATHVMRAPLADDDDDDDDDDDLDFGPTGAHEDEATPAHVAAPEPPPPPVGSYEGPATQTDYVPDESELGPPEVARWKVVPTGWGMVPDEGAPTPPPAPAPRPPAALRTVMWNLEDEERARAGDAAGDGKSWTASAPPRAPTDGTTAIAAQYLGDALNALEEISAFQRQLDPEARRALNAKVFACQQKLKRALGLLGAEAVRSDGGD